MNAVAPQALVVGFGAMGHYVGWTLAKNGFAVSIWGRRGSQREPVDRMAELGFGTYKEQFSVAPVDLAKTFPLVVVCVKAYDLHQAVVGDGTSPVPFGLKVEPKYVVVVANGAVLPLLNTYEKHWDKISWSLGLSTIGVSGDGGFQVRSKDGKITVGPMTGGLYRPNHLGLAQGSLVQTYPQLFAHGTAESRNPPEIFRTQWHWVDSIRQPYFLKWMINTTLNTLCAVQRHRSNREVLGDESLLRAVSQEAYGLYREIFDPGPVPEISFSDAYLELSRVILLTADNENSMARDRRQGRPIEHAFLGGLVQQASSPLQDYPLLCRFDKELRGI
jgi:ketopantoate reductase